MTTYVYAIARADDLDLPEDLTGVGDPARPVRVVKHDDLAAVVAEAPAGIRPKRRDLMAHQRVVDAAASNGPVLPMRFGSLADDDGAVGKVLDERAEHWRERLSALEGKAEYNLKAVHRTDAVIHQVLAEEPEIRAVSDAQRTAGGGTHEDKLRLGEMVAAAVNAREKRDAELVREKLAGHAEAVQSGPGSQAWIADLSFLLTAESAGQFLTAVDELARDHPHLELTVNGPLPPYSFVEPATASAAPAV
ncbi:GvpL/GvpF family gas vesicle protein [Actinacidiphila acidipaludis]|uniref:GvpL/GvpF family gas vesicle protein n=1 Tax=Actinacidiphila acidipaludis TaxID=2873382 RepID=A0ABS7QI80_9ACTN|nr:GvpL/GvpF family gas vesicle protein [Streptomyces acidipaludis]MBY8881489.1 GvpL/GvpF family gas vesicle protein [Streptomyces acidipaludis]